MDPQQRQVDAELSSLLEKCLIALHQQYYVQWNVCSPSLRVPLLVPPHSEVLVYHSHLHIYASSAFREYRALLATFRRIQSQLSPSLAVPYKVPDSCLLPPRRLTKEGHETAKLICVESERERNDGRGGTPRTPTRETSHKHATNIPNSANSATPPHPNPHPNALSSSSQFASPLRRSSTGSSAEVFLPNPTHLPINGNHVASPPLHPHLHPLHPNHPNPHSRVSSSSSRPSSVLHHHDISAGVSGEGGITGTGGTESYEGAVIVPQLYYTIPH